MHKIIKETNIKKQQEEEEEERWQQIMGICTIMRRWTCMAFTVFVCVIIKILCIVRRWIWLSDKQANTTDQRRWRQREKNPKQNMKRIQ